jgi:elongation factor 2
MFAAILSAEPTLLEPIYKIQVRIPPTELGNVTSLISRKRGSIHNVEQSGPAVTVTGMIPVSETLGLSQEMRAATSGSAFWQSTFDHWAPVPPTLQMETVAKVRTRKGLDPTPPSASRYIVKE